MFPAAECHIRNGALCFTIFQDLQAEILDTHWTSGKPAMDEHKCQYCCYHVKRPASWTYLATRAFLSYQFSCHGFIQFVRLGGPTADRSNRRKWTAAKHATGTCLFMFIFEWTSGSWLMRPVTAAVGSGSLSSLVIALARDYFWGDFSNGGVIQVPSALEIFPSSLELSSEWRLDSTSVALGFLIGLSFGPFLDLAIFVRLAWVRFVQQTLRGGWSRQLYRVLGWALRKHLLRLRCWGVRSRLWGCRWPLWTGGFEDWKLQLRSHWVSTRKPRCQRLPRWARGLPRVPDLCLQPPRCGVLLHLLGALLGQRIWTLGRVWLLGSAPSWGEEPLVNIRPVGSPQYLLHCGGGLRGQSFASSWLLHILWGGERSLQEGPSVWSLRLCGLCQHLGSYSSIGSWRIWAPTCVATAAWLNSLTAVQLHCLFWLVRRGQSIPCILLWSLILRLQRRKCPLRRFWSHVLRIGC